MQTPLIIIINHNVALQVKSMTSKTRSNSNFILTIFYIKLIK
jgi:hypothetical protein